MTKKEATDLRAILVSCPQTPKIKFAVAIVDKQLAYFESMKGQIKEQWEDISHWM